MCGIAGFLIKDGWDASSMHTAASKMANALRHRGPDDEGVWIDSDVAVALSHRRLAIQDLSLNGSQPMHSLSGRYCITFNGEVYNFTTLSRELSKEGYRFRGHSDTEVLLTAVEAWGLETALRRSVGMFAFALWDQEEKVLHLVRDRMGEKPLYYGWLRDIFVFGSELKSLRSHPKWAAEIDRHALTLHMRYGYVPTPFSIYKYIYKLPPGTILSITSKNVISLDRFSPHKDEPGEWQACPRSYWSLSVVARAGLSRSIQSEDEAVEELDLLLHEAVRDQMIADVPLGAFLSGGIDSSTVVAVMQSVCSKPVRTFTIGFQEEDYDEARYARRIADHLGTEHTELYLSPQDALEVIPLLATVYDEPFSDSSQIPAYLVSEMARKHVTVCLSGDGGDELFAGYNRYLWTEKLGQRLHLAPRWLKEAMAWMLTTVPPTQWDNVFSVLNRRLFRREHAQPSAGLKVHKFAQMLRQNEIADMYQQLVSYWDAPASLVLNGDGSSTAIVHDVIENCGFIQQAMYWDLLSYLPDDNLTKVDRASMAFGLETRLPLLNHRIVEFAWRLPVSMKVRRTEGKWILRQVLSRYVPSELFERPKMGFSVPVGQWLRGPLRDWAEDLLSESKLSQEGFFDVSIVRNKWHEHLSGRRNWQLPIWSVLMFQAWHNASH